MVQRVFWLQVSLRPGRGADPWVCAYTSRWRVQSRMLACAVTSLRPDLLELIGKCLKLLIRQRLDIDHAVIRRSDRPDDFVQLQMDGPGIPILRILNKKHYEERYHRGTCIHDQLPGIRIMKMRPCCSPEHNRRD